MITDMVIVPVKGGQLKVLSNDQMKELNKAMVEVLENIETKNLPNDSREIMKEKSCDVGHGSKSVEIPESFLMKYIEITPNEKTL